MVLDPIPQSLRVHFFGSRPQPPTSPPYCFWISSTTTSQTHRNHTRTPHSLNTHSQKLSWISSTTTPRTQRFHTPTPHSHNTQSDAFWECITHTTSFSHNILMMVREWCSGVTVLEIQKQYGVASRTRPFHMMLCEWCNGVNVLEIQKQSMEWLRIVGSLKF